MIYKIRMTKNILFDFALIILVLYNLIFVTSCVATLYIIPEYGYRIINIVCLSLLFCKIVSTRFTKAEILKVAILLFIGLIVSIRTHDDSTFLFVMFCAAAKNIDYQKTLRRLFPIILISVSLIICMSLIGVIDNKTEVGFSIWEKRTYWGFRHPNYCGTYFLDLILLLFVCVSGKLHKRDICFIGLIFLLDFIGPKTKTTIIIILILLLLYWIGRCAKKFSNKNFLSKAKWLPIIVFIIMIISIYQYENGSKIMLFFNDVFSGRISQMSYYFNKYGITFWGQELENISYREVTNASFVHTLDNGFLYLLLGKGILFFCVYLYLLINSIKQFIKKRMYDLVVVLVMIIIWGFMETYLYRVEMAPIIILLSSGLYTNSRFNKDRRNL